MVKDEIVSHPLTILSKLWPVWNGTNVTRGLEGAKYMVTESLSDKDCTGQDSFLSGGPYLCLEMYIIGTPGIFRILRLSSLSTVATM